MFVTHPANMHPLEPVRDLLDLSNVEKGHFLYDGGVRENQLGLWKSEIGAKKIVEFVGEYMNVALLSKTIFFFFFFGSNFANIIFLINLVPGIRAKSYFIRTECSENKGRIDKIALKGVPKKFRRQMTLEKFRSALLSCRSFDVDIFALRSSRHRVSMRTMRKVAFNSFDDKTSLATCGVHSRPYGSMWIEEDEKHGACSFCQPHFRALMAVQPRRVLNTVDPD